MTDGLSSDTDSRALLTLSLPSEGATALLPSLSLLLLPKPMEPLHLPRLLSIRLLKMLSRHSVHLLVPLPT